MILLIFQCYLFPCCPSFPPSPSWILWSNITLILLHSYFPALQYTHLTKTHSEIQLSEIYAIVFLQLNWAAEKDRTIWANLTFSPWIWTSNGVLMPPSNYIISPSSNHCFFLLNNSHSIFSFLSPHISSSLLHLNWCWCFLLNRENGNYQNRYFSDSPHMDPFLAFVSTLETSFLPISHGLV